MAFGQDLETFPSSKLKASLNSPAFIYKWGHGRNYFLSERRLSNTNLIFNASICCPRLLVKQLTFWGSAFLNKSETEFLLYLACTKSKDEPQTRTSSTSVEIPLAPKEKITILEDFVRDRWE